MASKAQICLNEMYRVMEPHEHMLPADRMEDYKALKELGLMQMSKIYNLMWGGSFLADGVSGQCSTMNRFRAYLSEPHLPECPILQVPSS
jgi:hypothetical protein